MSRLISGSATWSNPRASSRPRGLVTRRPCTLHKSAMPDGALWDAPKTVQRLLVHASARLTRLIDVIHEVDSALRALIDREAGIRDVEVVFDAPTRGLGEPAHHANRRRLPLRHPRGPAPPGARRAQRVQRGRDPHHRPAPAAAALQAVLPGHRLDTATRGRAPAAVGATGCVSAVRRDAGRSARRAAWPSLACQFR